ncbi:MAG: hypothetical protein NTU88_12170 [Armatimonadetes bacterium]|nr:hypothetical protein [Armatimonadota bacterium]
MHQLYQPPEEPEELEYHPAEVRRSFRLLSMDVIFYICGLAFIDPSTVVQSFLATLTNSSILIGAITALRPAGIFLPQLWTAHHLRNRVCHKSFMMGVASVSRIAISLFAIVLLIARPENRLLMTAAFVIMYIAFWSSEGVAGVPWTDLMAKSIPERLRGRLFGLTQLAGGILAVLAGLVITRMLSPSGPAYPANYAILMVLGAAFFWMSFASLSAVREPQGVPEGGDSGFFAYLGEVGRMLADHRQLKRLIGVQLLLGFFGMALPFYILYAKQSVGVTGTMVGVLLIVQTAGSMLISAVVGYMSDHIGPKWAIVASGLTGILAPLVVLLELAEPCERRSYIGLMNTAGAPTMVFPFIGGLIAQVFSYRAVFAVTALALGIGLILALGLRSKERISA